MVNSKMLLTQPTMKAIQFLDTPFHHFSSKKEKWRYIVISSLFFVLFLSIYRPFGIYTEALSEDFSTLEFMITLVSLGIVVFIVLCLGQFTFRKRLISTEVNLRIFFKWFLFDILLIVLAMSLIEFFVFEDDVITLNNVFDEIVLDVFETFLILFFTLLYPVIGTLAFVYLKKLYSDKKELEKDLEVVKVHYEIASGNGALVEILDENDVCKLTAPINSIQVIESRNQYVLVKHEKNNRFIDQHIRARFSTVFDNLKEFPSIIRCHRSFAVNLMNVEGLKYINQKPYLILTSSEDIKIPISKTYLASVKMKLAQY